MGLNSIFKSIVMFHIYFYISRKKILNLIESVIYALHTPWSKWLSWVFDQGPKIIPLSSSYGFFQTGNMGSSTIIGRSSTIIRGNFK